MLGWVMENRVPADLVHLGTELLATSLQAGTETTAMVRA